jgi:hypothetical protein
MTFPENLNDGLELELPEIASADQGLRLTYEVRNGSGQVAYLVNELFDRGSDGFRVDPDLVYCELGEDGTLYLRKQLVDVPDDLDVEAPEVPYLTRVEPDAIFAETVQLGFPIPPRDPYRPQSAAAEPVRAGRFVFTLGYLLEEEPIQVETVPLQSGSHLRANYGDVRPLQRLKVKGPFEAELLVAIQW